jgi:CheY-like chemotaxis protein
LSNAIKFTPVNGEITVTARYLDENLEILVQDNGIGIASDKLNKIFNSFAQVDDSIVRKYGGTGLGLAISKQFTLLLGGEILVESQEGIGTLFTVRIPMQEGDSTENSEVSYDFEHPLHGHVLVAEDVAANQMFLEIILKGCGLSLDVANNGLEAVEKFEENQYDLILMDENMPLLNGIGATKMIRDKEEERSTAPIPIIAITANALVGDREKFLESGMDDYVSKPIDPNQLKLLLYKYLDS